MFIPGNEIESPSARRCIEVSVWLVLIKEDDSTPQEFDEAESDLVLDGFGIAEHNLGGARQRSLAGEEESTPLTSTALSSSGV